MDKYQEIYEILKNIPFTSATEIPSIQKKLLEVVEKSPIAFHFSMVKQYFRILIFRYINESFVQEDEIKEFPSAIDLKQRWQTFWEVLQENNVQSIVFEQDADISLLRQFLLGKKVDLVGIKINVVKSYNYELATEFFDNFMRLFSYINKSTPSQQVSIYKTSKEGTNNVLNKMYVSLAEMIQNLFADVERIKVLLYYPSQRIGKPKATGMYFFFDDEKMNLENAKVHYSENVKFRSDFLYLSNGERINSFIFCKGISVHQLYCVIENLVKGVAINVKEVLDIEINALHVSVQDFQTLQIAYNDIIKEKNDFYKKLQGLEKENQNLLKKNANLSKENQDFLEKNKELQKNQHIAIATKMEHVDLEIPNDVDLNMEYIKKLSNTHNITPEQALKLVSDKDIEKFILHSKDTEVIHLLLKETEKIARLIEQKAKVDPGFVLQIKDNLLSASPSHFMEAQKNWSRYITEQAVFPDIEDYYFSKICHFADIKTGGSGLFILNWDWNMWIVGMFDLEAKGLESSFYMIEMKMLFEKFLDNNPQNIMFDLHKEITKIRKRRKFPCFSALIGVFNGIEHSFTFIRAGLPHLYVYNNELREGKFVDSYGIPKIGLPLPDEFFMQKPTTINLLYGNTIVMQTDNILYTNLDLNCFPETVAKCFDQEHNTPKKYLFKTKLIEKYTTASIKELFQTNQTFLSDNIEIKENNDQLQINDKDLNKIYIIEKLNNQESTICQKLEMIHYLEELLVNHSNDKMLDTDLYLFSFSRTK